MNVSNRSPKGPVYFNIEIPPVSLNFDADLSQWLAALIPIALMIGLAIACS